MERQSGLALIVRRAISESHEVSREGCHGYMAVSLERACVIIIAMHSLHLDHSGARLVESIIPVYTIYVGLATLL